MSLPCSAQRTESGRPPALQSGVDRGDPALWRGIAKKVWVRVWVRAGAAQPVALPLGSAAVTRSRQLTARRAEDGGCVSRNRFCAGCCGLTRNRETSDTLGTRTPPIRGWGRPGAAGQPVHVGRVRFRKHGDVIAGWPPLDGRFADAAGLQRQQHALEPGAAGSRGTVEVDRHAGGMDRAARGVTVLTGRGPA